ncbi:MAG: type 4a pilus biogenesis protein PilO [Deltaproteobacteria bacterium]|nr:type 4a pilus biogenesis protein PilO [Deltaproteobacteria bacterium]
MEKFIAEFAKVPGPHKALGTFVVAFIIVLGGYLGMVSDTIDEIETHKKENETLVTQKNTLNERARNLGEYGRKVERLKQRLRKAQDQLPTKSEIPNLLRDIDFEAQQSGLRILRFDVQKEKTKKDRADIPLKMKVKGSYHELAVFFDKVSKMDRIVNVSNLDIGKAKYENKRIVLTSAFVATTYRFINQKKKPKKGLKLK